MKIVAINVYQIDVPLPTVYRWSRNRSIDSLDDTIVEIVTDEGISGIGESCPWGSQVLAAYADGVRCGLDIIAPAVIGADPRCLKDINRRMDTALVGHPYVKHGIDIACWDILGKCSGMPVYDLLGGRLTDKARARIGVSAASPEEMLETIRNHQSRGYSMFSLKVGDEPDLDIARLRTLSEGLLPGQTLTADANGGWLPHEAIRVVQSVANSTNVFIEQPCQTYDECLLVRRATSLPMILDECIADEADVARAYADKACDIVNIKASRIGGITRTAYLRDICLSLGMSVFIMDTSNTEIGGAVTMHLAHSTSTPRALLAVWNTNDWRDIELATGAPVDADGWVSIEGERPGLGLTMDMSMLDAPIKCYS